MKDEVSGHTARLRKEFFRNGVEKFSGPPFSSDSNPIEFLWDQMKMYIDNRMPVSYGAERFSYGGLCEIVTED